MQDSNETIREQVLSAIHDGRACMRPRWQFVLRGTLAVLGGVLIGLALLYVISLIIFVSQENGSAFVSEFGWKGMRVLMGALPLLLIGLCILFVVLLEILVRRYAFAYRRPLLYSIGGILVIAVCGGVLVARTSLHARLYLRVREHRLPFAERLYSNALLLPPGLYRGIVTATTTDGILLRQGDGAVLRVTVTDATRWSRSVDELMEMPAFVFGAPASGTIDAFGIRSLPRH